MRKRIILSVSALALALGAARGHDMFLVPPGGEVAPGGEIAVALYNGTFEQSENTIDRERMRDVTVIDGDGWAHHPLAPAWRDAGSTSVLTLAAGPPGTLLVGVSTRPRLLELSAEEFNEYLRHDGVRDVLDERLREGSFETDASEWYAKHVKTLIHVGGRSTDTWSQRLGHPVEIVPLADPFELRVGDTLAALVLVDGEPFAGQLVYAGYEGYRPPGGTSEAGGRDAQEARSDVNGVIRFDITRPGRWYLRLIHMTPSGEEGIDYESNWATLTFTVAGQAGH